MATSMTPPPLETEGNKTAASFHMPAGLETVGKPIAIACFNAAIESFVEGQRRSRGWLAEEICGMSEANFSKVANAQQGDFWALVYKLPTDVRSDFFDRLAETERVDPLMVAMEQLNAAMFRVMRLTGAASLPQKATHMARAALAERKKRRAS